MIRFAAILTFTKKTLFTLHRVSPAMLRLLFIMVSVMYVFATVGLEVFANKLDPAKLPPVGCAVCAVLGSFL